MEPTTCKMQSFAKILFGIADPIYEWNIKLGFLQLIKLMTLLKLKYSGMICMCVEDDKSLELIYSCTMY